MTDTNPQNGSVNVNEASILNTVKSKVLVDPENDVFDLLIASNINTSFLYLNQIGVGPEEGFEITGPGESWNDFTKGDKRLLGVKDYISLKVRLLFDPPQTSFAIKAIEDQIRELEWRLLTYAERSIST